MRVILMHNPSAGRENHSADELIDEIARRGHDVIVHADGPEELAAALRQDCDLVVVAGGDGTVGQAADVLRGTGVPFTILPRGTANNVARTFGAEGCAWWRDGIVRPLDIGFARVDGNTERFLEAFGFGAFPRVIDQAHAAAEPTDPAARLARDLTLLEARLEASPPRPYVISADGVDLSGEYFLVEVLNIPSIGPRVPLAPAADPGDGALDLVLVGAAHRDQLLRGMERLARGEEPAFALPTWRVSLVAIGGQMRRYHVDGALHDGPVTLAEVWVAPRALQILVPRDR